MDNQQEKLPISVYVLTYNSMRTIEKCLRSLWWAEELVIVDSFSTDGTLDICKRYTEKIYQAPWKGFKTQYQYAADLTTKEWIMVVDSDEEIPSNLVEEIRRELAIGKEKIDGFYINRKTYYLGKWINYGGWYPDGKIRLYRKSKGRWEGDDPHPTVVVKGRVKILRNHYLHYTYKDISDHIQTIDRYTKMAAQAMLKKGKRFSVLNLLFNPLFRFIKEYIIKQGFRDGIPGLIIIVSTMFYVFMKYAKLWEITREKDIGK